MGITIDLYGNIDSIRDNGRNHRLQTYKYDDANRLIGSDGSIMQEHSTAQPYGYQSGYKYSLAGRLLNKYVDSKRLSTAMGPHTVRYDNEYSYTHPDNPYAITHIQDAYGAHYDFDWDDNGNLVNSHTHATHTDRRLCWTEDNRLQAFIERGGEGGIAAYYNYSADGERNIKLTSPRLNIQQNATLFNNPPLIYPTLYASPLVTLTKQGYTKHYFEEGRRICSKIGGGMQGNVTVQEIDSRVGELASNYDEQYHNQKEGIRQTFHHCIGADPQIIDGVNLHHILVEREVQRDEDEPTFFYHSDHLGSAAYLTYHGGVIQTLNYLPYGEDWVELNFFAPHDTTRLGIYTYNGKDPRKGWRIPLDEIKYNEQKDYESGFHYYGARYYGSELLTGWLSVDPMADKYPSISPYAYCIWNPVKLIDPDGMQVRPSLRYATFNSPQRYVSSNIRQTVYRQSGNTTTQYSRSGCPNLSHAPLPFDYIRQQKWNGIVSQYNASSGPLKIEPIAKLISNELEKINEMLASNQYSIIRTEANVYTDRGNSSYTDIQIKFDNADAQVAFDEAQAAWNAANNLINQRYSVTLPNGATTLTGEGFRKALELGKSPKERALDEFRKNRGKYKIVATTTRSIPTIRATD